MKYAVHLFPTVRVKVIDIEADSVTDAVSKAEASVDMHEILDNRSPSAKNVEAVEWDDGLNNFVLVDPLDEKGAVIYEESSWLDGEGNQLVDGLTLVERKAAAADAATLFMQELLGVVIALEHVPEAYGIQTLVDLMQIQSAIVQVASVSVKYPYSSAIELTSSLPSGERWMKFIGPEVVVPRETDRS